MIADGDGDRGLGLQGVYAGVATRSAAFAIDVAVIVTIYALAGFVLERMLALFLGRSVRVSDAAVVSSIALGAWWFLYCAYPLAVAGRTAGMAVLGLRAVRDDGSDLGTGDALLRVIVFPLSFLLCGAGFVLIVLRRDHRALHDLLAGSAVVYSWQARVGHLGFLARSGPTAPS